MIQNSPITITMGSKQDFIQLADLDYTNTYDTMFTVSFADKTITLGEINLPNPVTNPSHIYTEEITNEMSMKIDDPSIIPLVAIYNGKPAGYLMAQWQQRSRKKVCVIDGILVANQFARKGLGKALLREMITLATNESGCAGIHAEMCTQKYQANNLLLAMGFVFAGTKSFVWENTPPKPYSKEALYFYYPIAE